MIRVQQVQEALNYFGVASPERWREIWLGAQVSYRRSPAFQSDPGTVAASASQRGVGRPGD